MAASKGSRDTAPARQTGSEAFSTSGTGADSEFGRGPGSLLGRLRQTFSANRAQSTAPGVVSDLRGLAGLKGRASDLELARQIRETFYKKFANIGPTATDQERDNEKGYFTEKVAEAISEVLAERKLKLSDDVVTRIRDELLEGILGFGPLQKLLEDPDITEIMVNGPHKVFVERKGKLYLTDLSFGDNDQLMQVVEKIVVPLGRRVDESSPMTDARLPDGSRVNIVIRPLALCGPTITIRKFHKIPLKLDDLVAAGTLSREMAIFLEGCVRSKLNIIVSGETGSGKTTTLNALSGFLPHDARIITIEDSAELQLQQEHVVQLEARQANMEGTGEVTIRNLLRNALHMIPDRVIVGECRGGEALDMLNAMSSGNDGSMTTGHANTPQDMIGRLETMVMMAGMGLPSQAIREQIASAINLLVHQSRGKDGHRRVTSIAEVCGIRGDAVQVSEVFRWDPMALNPHTGEPEGRHVPTGIVPQNLPRLLRDEFFIPDGTFGPEVDIDRVREELKAIETEELRQEEASRKARRVMQSALAKPDAVESESSTGSFFHWRVAMPAADESSTLTPLTGVAPSHRDRLRELSEQMAASRKGLSLRVNKEDDDQELVNELRGMVLERLPSAGSFEELDKTYQSVEDERRVITARIERAITEILIDEKLDLSAQLRKRVLDEVLNDVVGLGPLQVLLDDPEVNEVMVNGPDRVYVERGGKLVLTQVKFKEETHLRHIISQILRPIGRRVDETTPMVDARLKDGSRVNIVIPPIALCGPTVTIRRFARDPFDMTDLVSFGTLTSSAAAFLNAAVRARLNMVISGSTGSGKTTTLNAISSFISDDCRIITIEDAAELQLQQDHVLSLEARQANIEGKGSITIRQLVMNALHMRPDRILVGECRGGEALDMLLAMNTGQDGSLTTLHSNSPYDAILRLQTMVMLAGMNLPLRAINEQIDGAIHLIVHQDRLTDGTRRITHISELAGFTDDHPNLVDIYRWVPRGIGPKEMHLGALEPTGKVPSLIARFVEDNIELPPGAFGPDIDIDELYAELQAEQKRRSELERVRLLKLAREEEAKDEAAAEAAEAVERARTVADTLSGTEGGPMLRRSILQTRVFTWKDAAREEAEVETGVMPTSHNARRWQVFKKLRALNPRRSARRTEDDDFEHARLILTQQVTKELETTEIPDDFTTVDSERVFMATLITQAYQKLRERQEMILERAQEDALLGRVLSEFCGYGPVQGLIDDPEISEIMVNGPSKVFVERRGRMELSDAVFEDDAHIVRILQRMLGPVNRRCDITSPMVDARLPDGSRINAVIMPLAISGSTLTIRKFARDPYTIEMLVEAMSMSADMATFLKAAVQARLNVVVSGGTGSGKTTTLNAISAFIPDTDRIVTIEDTAELQLQQDHVVALESRPANLEGAGQVTIRELVRNALHMRPDRILVGECRGGEALDMLQAMATGQAGSLTTAHANTPKEMISRLEVMVLMASTGLSMASIREQITNTIDLIVQQERFKDGTRRITRVSEVTGLDDHGEVAIQDVFTYKVEGISTEGSVVGKHVPTGYIPRALRLFRSANVPLPDMMFGENTSVEREYERIFRQHQIEQQRERQLEQMRYRSELGAHSVRVEKSANMSSVTDEIARRRQEKTSVAQLLSQREQTTEAAVRAPRSDTDHHELAQEMRDRMLERPEQDEQPLPPQMGDQLAQLERPSGQDPAEANELAERMRARVTPDPALLRRLRAIKKERGDR